MSATGFLILLIVTIALLMVLIMKVKLHPTFALFASALFMGLILGRFEPEGFSFTEVLSLITSGFGGTLGSMGIPIMLGAILAMGVQDTGAAKAIGLVIPELNGKLIGAAQRVPTPTGSTTILNAVVKGAVTVEQVNAQMKAEATESFGYNTDEIVSSDIIGMRFGSLFDATQRAAGTRPVLKGTEPDIPFIRFKNYLKAAPVSSDSAYIIGAPLDDVRYLYGVLPANREAYVLKGDIPDPALYLARYLTDQLQQKGIRVDGSPSCYRIEVEENRWKKGERKEIVTTYSPTLREIASVCNHVSHNLYADALVKTVGLQYKPRRNEMISSFGRGVQVVKEYWEKKGLDVFPLRMNDGSGLAPADKVSAGFMGELLGYMATESAVSDAFIASLPQAGIEGSVRNFLKGSKLQGKAHLKSGGITGVRSYAGYITKDGKTYAVAVFSNNYSCPLSRMTRALEKLLLHLF